MTAEEKYRPCAWGGLCRKGGGPALFVYGDIVTTSFNAQGNETRTVRKPPESKITIGKYEISLRTLPNQPQSVCLSIYVDDGEGGTFDIDLFKKAIDAFYKEHF